MGAISVFDWWLDRQTWGLAEGVLEAVRVMMTVLGHSLALAYASYHPEASLQFEGPLLRKHAEICSIDHSMRFVRRSVLEVGLGAVVLVVLALAGKAGYRLAKYATVSAVADFVDSIDQALRSFPLPFQSQALALYALARG